MSCIHCPHCNERQDKQKKELDFLQTVRVKLTYNEPCNHPSDWVTSVSEGQGNSSEVCLCGADGCNRVMPASQGPHNLKYIDMLIAGVKRRMKS